MQTNRTQLEGKLLILTTVFLWSISGVLIKYIPWNSIVINSMRSILALILFMGVRKGFHVKINRSILGGAICLVGVTTLFVCANKLTTAANAIVLQYLSPVFVILMTCIKEKRRPSLRDCILVFVTFAGTVLFFLDQLDMGHMIGNILAILSGVAFAGVFFFNAQPDGSSDDANLLGFLLSFLIGLPFWFIYRPQFTASSVTAILLLGFFQLGLAYLVFGRGLKKTDAVSASLISMLETILNPLWVFLVFGERPGKFAFLGGVIIIAAVAANIVLPEEKKNTGTDQ